MYRSHYLLFATLLIISIPHGYAQSITDQMKSAMSLHEAATNFEQELAAAEKFKSISDNNPNEWLPAYWTAFLYSQAGRLGKTKLLHYEIGFDYLAKVEKLIVNPTDDEKSYIFALKSLLSTLSQGPNFAKGNIEKGKELVVAQNEALNKGLSAKSDSPLLLVLLGTNLIGEGMRAKPSPDVSKLITGKLLLEKAKSIYAASSAEDNLIPNRWNEPWIDVWLNRLKQN